MKEINKDTQRTGWIDLLRIFACLLVVFAHCCDGFVGAFDTDRGAFMAGAALGSLSRPSVPLFVLMTAILLLPISGQPTLGGFYRKRIGRIIPPLIFWSVALPVLFYIYFGIINPSSGNPMVDTSLYTGSNLWKKIWLMVFNFNFDTVPLWYLYMLVGLYLIMPIINSWLASASKHDVQLVLKIWGFTLFIPYLRLLAPHVGYEGNFGSMEIFGACDWNAYGTFYYLTGFIGYLILAFYIKKWPLQWSTGKTLAVGIPMFALGYLITFGGFVTIQDYYPGDYSFLEVIWYFTGINVFMMTLPILLIFSRIKIMSTAWMRRLANLTFGIYLCHFIFVYVTFDLFNLAVLPPVVRILCMTAVTFAVSALVAWLFRQTKFTRLFIA